MKLDDWASLGEMCEVLIKEGKMPEFLKAFPGYHVQVRSELPKSLHGRLPTKPKSVERLK